MNLSKIKVRIYRMDLDEIAQIQRYCKKRTAIIRHEQHAIKMTEAWDWAKTLSPGAEIWCAVSGDLLLRGNKLIVQARQPRKVLWVKHNGKFIGFGPAMIVRYQLQSKPIVNGKRMT